MMMNTQVHVDLTKSRCIQFAWFIFYIKNFCDKMEWQMILPCSTQRAYQSTFFYCYNIHDITLFFKIASLLVTTIDPS